MSQSYQLPNHFRKSQFQQFKLFKQYKLVINVERNNVDQ